MDQKTIQHYQDNAEGMMVRYGQAADLFRATLRTTFNAGDRVLDIGSGTGRDLQILLELGCDAYGAEPSSAMRDISSKQYENLAGRIVDAGLPELGKPFGGEFDGITCTAVLMHLPKAEQLDAAMAIRNNLKLNGLLLLSFPVSRTGLDDQNRDEFGRLFTPIDPNETQLLFERIGFSLEEKTIRDDGLGRVDQKWHVMRFRFKHQMGSRPIDLIEGVMNRDQRTATYKLALFRALAEIATTEFGQARWLGDGTVGIPIHTLAEKWIQYYWPLVGSRIFIPQIWGESENSRTPIAFRKCLLELVQSYDSLGGLSAFTMDQKSGKLPKSVLQTYQRVISKVGSTIVVGPVKFSGGSLEGGRLFSYEPKQKLVIAPASIWMELSMMGNWVEDAVILRWAEFTSAITKGVIRPSQVIDLLLERPTAARDVLEARKILASQETLECVWTGKSIHQKFAVDHVIPYSLWHNNSLWNLLPAAEAVNGLKSDKLPTRRLVVQRRDSIIGTWELFRKASTERFMFESDQLLGGRKEQKNWQGELFAALSEAIEYTANQRGIERWEPRG